MKTMFSSKNFQKIIFISFILGLIFFFFNLSNNRIVDMLGNARYNQKGGVLAQEESKLFCKPEIPNGEAMDKTGEFLLALMKELSDIDKAITGQTEAAGEVNDLANQCDLGKCSPNCWIEDVSGCLLCSSQECLPEEQICVDESSGDCEKWGSCLLGQECRSSDCSGQPCPVAEITTEFTKIDQAYTKIDSAEKKIKALIDEETEPLCVADNVDIRTLTDELGCKACWEGTGYCPQLTKTEVIRRKLYKARKIFDECVTLPSDWSKVERGEKNAKQVASCKDVLGGVYAGSLIEIPKENAERLKEKGELCKSWGNYFCCQ